MRCGAIQKESRPITRCQRMSQPTPQPPTSFAATIGVQEPWAGTIRFKWLVRLPSSEMAPLLDDPTGWLGDRYGGGKFKMNLHHGMHFVDMPSDETRRLLKLFGVAVTSLEDAIERRAPVDEIMKWDHEVAERTRETIAFVERLRSRRIG